MGTMETITHEGKLYRKVARKARVGDKFIQITESRAVDLTIGRVYALTGFDEDEDGLFYGDTGDLRYTLGKQYVVLEPVTDTAHNTPIMLISTTPAVEKTYTIQLTAGAMNKLVHALRYYASDVSSGEELRDRFEAIRQS
ncbi:hypothetical protein [Brevibacillus laterosporus]|uniref:Uncharacterized protein n=1 Tax=Brevibacillus laterosporus TaxID=1465 RepID=A0AAP3DLF7_BRELA|nr:hypothetical protein [Brevibacillus laterosporus]MCR8983390.1 hypothetical protein [Brevibacillus laterosporus]MCZ0810546.1 hypothetical protein [Brevibacillus laterosporus]MCZ0829080.1 hypothetical protein [Brevibacillus laterosporus]MCZ0853251.1 hypothetical protein [Brevibacillus laterosporus]